MRVFHSQCTSRQDGKDLILTIKDDSSSSDPVEFAVESLVSTPLPRAIPWLLVTRLRAPGALSIPENVTSLPEAAGCPANALWLISSGLPTKQD